MKPVHNAGERNNCAYLPVRMSGVRETLRTVPEHARRTPEAMPRVRWSRYTIDRRRPAAARARVAAGKPHAMRRHAPTSRRPGPQPNRKKSAERPPRRLHKGVRRKKPYTSSIGRLSRFRGEDHLGMFHCIMQFSLARRGAKCNLARERSY